MDKNILPGSFPIGPQPVKKIFPREVKGTIGTVFPQGKRFINFGFNEIHYVTAYNSDFISSDKQLLNKWLPLKVGFVMIHLLRHTLTSHLKYFN